MCKTGNNKFYSARAFIVLALCLLNFYTAFSAQITQSMQERRELFARQLDVYDFEPRPDHLNSRDSDNDTFPDFWERLQGPNYARYEKINIIEDQWRMGISPLMPGHVLRMTFSGGEVGVRTIYPKLVDPQLAYEVTAFARTEGLENSIVAIDVVWLHVGENGREEILGEPDRLIVPKGQVDWSEAPLRRRVNSLHPKTNRVRIVCRVMNDPKTRKIDRHGTVWLDDIRLISRPKIGISSIFRNDNMPLKIDINYQGLIDNVPDPEYPDRMKGRKYWRKISIVNVHGDHPDKNIEGRKVLDPRNSTSVTEQITPTLPKLGIYYVNVVLYGADNQPQASVTQVVGRWLPPRRKPVQKRDTATIEQFGVGFDVLAARNVAKDDELEKALKHLGVFRAKIELWPEEYEGGETEKKIWGTPEMLRRIKADGIKLTGKFGRMPQDLFPEDGMLPAMRDRFKILKESIRKPVAEFGSQLDEWQWGDDTDPSFRLFSRASSIAAPRKSLQEMSSAFFQALPVVLGKSDKILPRQAAEAVNIFVPSMMDEDMMMASLARITPLKFGELVKWQREIFPPEYIVKLAARYYDPALETAARSESSMEKQMLWITLEPLSVDPHLREVSSERAQAIDIARKIILSQAIGYDRIWTGELVDPSKGLAAVSREGMVIPRPSFFVVRNLAERLSGTEYLGSFQLGAEIENYVFRTPHNTALLAIWHTGIKQDETVEIGTGLGKLIKYDMAGNTSRIFRRFKVGHMPILIDGISVPLARTRMSIGIMPDPPLRSKSESQRQRLTIRNFFSEPLIATFRLQYAAYADNKNRIRLEPGWSSPPALRINLPPGGSGTANKKVEARKYFDVRPTREAVIGRKYIRIETQLTSALDTRFNLLRTTDLTSSMQIRVTPVSSSNPAFKVVRISIIWNPDANQHNPPRLQLRPYYQVSGDQHMYQGVMTVYPARNRNDWSGAAIRDIRIPASYSGRRMWVGADEDGASRFVRREITALMKIK